MSPLRTCRILVALLLVLAVGCGEDPASPKPGVSLRDAEGRPIPLPRIGRPPTASGGVASPPVVGGLSPAVATSPKPALDLAEIQAQLEELRSLEFRADVKMDFTSRRAFGALVDADVARELGGETGAKREAGLTRLGLLTPDVDLRNQVREALGSQVAGWYDSRDGTFHLMGDLTDERTIRSTAAHELVHALQDQHFDLSDRQADAATRDDGTRDDDARFAIRALVEGEATFLQIAWMSREAGDEDAVRALASAGLASGLLAGLEFERLVNFADQQVAIMSQGDGLFDQMSALAKLDPYVAEPMLGAYMRGAWFVHNVYRAGGWEAVDALYSEPPTSAEQILHPKRFVKRRDEPTHLAMPDIVGLDTTRWHVADTAVHGELYLQMLLRRHGIAWKEAFKACTGWDGDVYRAWRTAKGETAMALATTWDTEDDAHEFAKAYGDAAGSKYPDHCNASGLPFAYSWRLNEGSEARGTVVVRGREVFIVEGFDGVVTPRVVAALRGMKIEYVD